MKMKKEFLLFYYLFAILAFTKHVVSMGDRCSCLLQDTPNEYDIAKTETCCSTTQDTQSYFNKVSRFCESTRFLGSISDPKAFAECCIRLSSGSRRFTCLNILGDSFDPTNSY